MENLRIKTCLHCGLEFHKPYKLSMKSWLIGTKKSGPTKFCSKLCANTNKRGCIGMRTGTTQSDEAKEKMRKSKLDLYAKRGYAHSLEMRDKISATCKERGVGKWAAGVPKPNTSGPLSSQ